MRYRMYDSAGVTVIRPASGARPFTAESYVLPSVHCVRPESGQCGPGTVVKGIRLCGDVVTAGACIFFVNDIVFLAVLFLGNMAFL